MAREIPCDYDGCPNSAGWLLTRMADGNAQSLCDEHFGTFVCAIADQIRASQAAQETESLDTAEQRALDNPDGAFPGTAHVRPAGPGRRRAEKKRAQTLAELEERRRQEAGGTEDPDPNDTDEQ